MMAILHDKVNIADAVNATPITLEDAPPLGMRSSTLEQRPSTSLILTATSRHKTPAYSTATN